MTRSRRATKSASHQGLPTDRVDKQRAKPLKRPAPARGRQVVRLLSILRLLEAARRGLTVSELHQAITEEGIDRCSPRTLYRDIEHLQQIGVQLVDNGGRWAAHSDRKAIQSSALQQSEVLSLLLSEDLLSPESAGVFGVALRDLRARLMAQLTPEGRAFVKELGATSIATYAAPARAPRNVRVFNAIDDACGREHCLRIIYSTPGKGRSERIVEPHLFWVREGRPYVVAYCRSANEFRTFAVQRIHAAEVLDEEFERRAGFDPASFVERGFGMLHGETHEISVEFAAEVAHLAAERVWHRSQHVSTKANGCAVLEMTAAGLPEIAAWVASFGGRARALAPEALVKAVRELHERGLRAHQAPKCDRRRHDRKGLTLDVKGWG